MQQYIKHKIERIRIYKLNTYAKFNLHWHIRLFVKLALKLLIDWKLIFPSGRPIPSTHNSVTKEIISGGRFTTRQVKFISMSSSCIIYTYSEEVLVHWDIYIYISIFKMAVVRHLGIVLPSMLLAAAACQISCQSVRASVRLSVTKVMNTISWKRVNRRTFS